MTSNEPIDTVDEASYGTRSLRSYSRSLQLREKALGELPDATSSNYRGKTSYDPYPMIFIESAEGATLTDVDGNEYVDFHCGVSSIIEGHCPPNQVEAVSAQLNRGAYFATAHELEAQAAALVNELLPNSDLTKFISTGTEAVMSAIRLARAYTGKDKILTFEGMYHGHNDDVLVNVHPNHASLGTRRNATKIPEATGVPTKKLELVESIPWNDIELLDERLDREGDNIAAIITEAVMSNSGLVWPNEGYLQELQSLARRHEVLFVLDEVVTGFRMDLHGAQGYFDLEPDLAIYGKALSNGYPNAAVTGREEVMRFLKAEPDKATFMGTFSGNPLVVAATLANLEQLNARGDDGYASLHANADRLATGLQDIVDDSPHPGYVPDPAGFTYLHFTDGQSTPADWQGWRDVDIHTDERKYAAFAAAMIGEGIFFPPKVGRINLMHAHRDEHVDRALEAAKVAIEAVPS